MTALVIVKYGAFNQSVLLTNTAYDIASVVRTAQTYGLSSANSDTSGSTQFTFPYGVDFSTSPGDKVILFADSYPLATPDGIYTAGSDAPLKTSTVVRGAKVTLLCVGSYAACSPSTATTNALQVDLTFQRPDPTAIICYKTLSSVNSCVDPGNSAIPVQYAKMMITGTDGSTRTLGVYRNGQVEITQ